MPPSDLETIARHRVRFRRRGDRNATWQADVTIDGKRHRPQAPTREAVRMAVIDLLAKRTPSATRITLKQLADESIQRARPGHSRVTAQSQAKALLKFFSPDFDAALLTTERVDAYIHSAATPSSRLKRSRYLRATLTRGGDAPLPCPWPMCGTSADPDSKAHKRSARKRRALTKAEARRLLAACDEPQLRTLVRLALATGARHAEMTSRHWRDVDLEAQRLWIGDQKACGFSPKTEGSTRFVDLAPQLVQDLATWRAEWAKQHGREAGLYDFVFPHPFDVSRPWTQEAVCKAAREAFTTAGLRDFAGRGLHALRRTAASWMLDAGRSIPVVMEVCGWTSPQVLLDTYATAGEAAKRAAVAGLGEALEGL